ncbi:hypothetical protein FO497_20730 [Bacillus cereus ATCC 10876]|uniref:Uncharacterized protein n=1 Tax=Bacillus thuringiensis TaxID=1428 RepID=A0AAW4HQK9_BACTU|nr:hypothetical protein F8162_22060 [Bacillus sp. CH140a_4T]KAB2474896.1 hypothetical protein F8160_04185 [Bacillus sp. CH126_4D]MBN9898191.1 hypothetical protein [Bacillus thuringiensis]MDR4131231.1 hypothetical protein [Bacillus cereus ATCC 10876]TKH47722.1 hypothetical protein FC698_14500 [Bacillus cereus]
MGCYRYKSYLSKKNWI